MNAEHTPAPWHTEPLQSDQGASIAICGPGDYGILAVIGPKNADDEPDIHTAVREPFDEANARLIVASPDLLNALRLVTGELQGRWLDDLDCVKQALAAIAKAEGQ